MVIAGAVGLAFGGVMLSDYAGVTVDLAGVHVVHQTADAAVVQGQIFMDVDTTSNVTGSIQTNEVGEVTFSIERNGAIDVNLVPGSREVVIQVPAGTVIQANGQITVDTKVTGGLGTALSQTLSGTFNDLMNTLQNIKLIGLPVGDLLSPLTNILTTTIDSLVTGTGDTVNKLVDVAVLGSTTV
ncbi:adhesive domain-containing protein [Weissella cibaria]|uniref:adhesive domain-containing protein n=1 Tax=Weissella cibaria TaxID=137591 RepID=UPI00106EA66B|nr:adhesive domain-containing protein [Weissella cibaria]